MTDHVPRETQISGPEDPAKISPADIERAKTAWKKHASPAFKNLLDAEIERRGA
jgi:hypothetical protein